MSHDVKKPTPRPGLIWRYCHEDRIVVRTIARVDPPHVHAQSAWWAGDGGAYVEALMSSSAWSCIGIETARSVIMLGEQRLARDLGVCDGLVTVVGIRDDGDVALRSHVDGSAIAYPAERVASWPLVPFTDSPLTPPQRPALAVLAADFEQELRRAEAAEAHARKSRRPEDEADAMAEVRVWAHALAKLRNVLSGRHPDAPPKPVTIEIVEPSAAPAAPPKAADLDAAIQAIISSPTRAMVDRAESWCEEHGVDVSYAANLAEVFQCWAAEYHRRGAHDEAVATALRARAAAQDSTPVHDAVDGTEAGAYTPSDPLTARLDGIETRLRALERCPKHPINVEHGIDAGSRCHEWVPIDGRKPHWDGDRSVRGSRGPRACKHCGVPMVPPGAGGSESKGAGASPVPDGEAARNERSAYGQELVYDLRTRPVDSAPMEEVVDVVCRCGGVAGTHHRIGIRGCDRSVPQLTDARFGLVEGVVNQARALYNDPKSDVEAERLADALDAMVAAFPLDFDAWPDVEAAPSHPSDFAMHFRVGARPDADLSNRLATAYALWTKLPLWPDADGGVVGFIPQPPTPAKVPVVFHGKRIGVATPDGGSVLIGETVEPASASVVLPDEPDDIVIAELNRLRALMKQGPRPTEGPYDIAERLFPGLVTRSPIHPIMDDARAAAAKRGAQEMDEAWRGVLVGLRHRVCSLAPVTTMEALAKIVETGGRKGSVRALDVPMLDRAAVLALFEDPE